MTTTRRGMSLIEALISLLIVGVMAAAGLAAAGHAARMKTIGMDRRESQWLASILLDEVLSRSMRSSVEGVSQERNRFMSIDDFNGFYQSPPRDISGAALKDDSWAWGVEIERCDESGLSREDGAMRRVSVMVYRDGIAKATVRSIVGEAFAEASP